MIRLAVSVEGQTEEEFVKTVLLDHLRSMAIEIQPIRIGRARNKHKGGGNVTIDGLASDMASLYGSFDAVTSLVDFYGFRDKGGRNVLDLETHLRVEVGNRIGGSWNETRVFPYVQQYEFEGLLFADVEAFSGLIDAPDDSVGALRRIRSQFPTPEDINDDPKQAHCRCHPKIPESRSRPPSRGDNGIGDNTVRMPAIQKVGITLGVTFRLTGTALSRLHINRRYSNRRPVTSDSSANA